jgi:predicted nucleic acid-binding protein
VALVADIGGIYALYDASDRHHRAVRRAVEAEAGPLILPAPVLGELDYLLRTRIGVDAELRLLEGVGNGPLTVEQFTRQDSVRCRALLLKYRELDLGLADASVIAVAERLGVKRILTVDERDFRAVRAADGKAFILVPRDERAGVRR